MTDVSRASPMEQRHSDTGGRWRLVVLVLLGAALLALTVAMLPFVGAKQYEPFVRAALIQSALYALAVWLIVSRRWDARALWVVLAVAAVARAIALFAPDTLSDDIYRYIWDGRVQAAGINPYRFVPDSPELEPLQDDLVFPQINRS